MASSPRLFATSLLFTLAFATACTAPHTTTDGAVDVTANETSADGPPADVSLACRGDNDCSNGVFCDGAERCMPGASGADARGCIAATAAPCLATQRCDEVMDRCETQCAMSLDADGDGHRAMSCGGDDCDDADANRFPGNPEVCDGANHDEDCDAMTFGVRDADMDGYPDARCCNVEGTSMHCGNDCNDSQSNMHPGLAEVCDSFDNDCNGTTDEGVTRTFYVDADGDGFGVDAMATNVIACHAAAGFADRAGDCDDTLQSAHPGAMEICDAAMVDEDCDGAANPSAICACSGDITRTCMMPGACAAGTERCVAGQWGNCSIVPVAETCNGIDDDCDGMTDEGITVTCFADNDNDGYAAADASVQTVCPVAGRESFGGCPPLLTNRDPAVAASNADCSDTDSSISPGAAETCNHSDDNCNGIVDESVQTTFFRDADLDMRGDPMASVTDCTPPMGYVSNGLDCDDANPAVFTGAPEICDGLDNNCDPGRVADEGVPTSVYYRDNDHDLHGDPNTSITSCRAPAGFVLDNTDCGPTGMVDQDSTIYLGALEVCDMKDNDCDGTPDDGAILQTYYLDNDCDGFGATTATPVGPRCGPPSTTPCYAPNNRDCNDSNRSVQPNSPEVCNLVDDNCSGAADEGLPLTQYYPDCDRDGYGDNTAAALSQCSTPTTAPTACTTCSPIQNCWATRTGDCNDRDGRVHQFATELCNNVDDDCNGLLDYYSPSPTPSYEDQDRDGFANTTCGGTDCNDTRATVHPGATEIVGDNVDQDCNGHELCWPDLDSDHFARYTSMTMPLTSSNTICNDSGQAATPPGGIQDCCDSEPLAHPGQTDFFPTARRGCGGYDYNCSGADERQYPNLTTLTCAGTCSSGQPGWTGAVPPCGVSGTFLAGCATPPFCVPIFVGQIQQCR